MNTSYLNSYSSQIPATTYETSKAEETISTEKTTGTGSYGRTIGQPKLSEKAAAYYEELKNKFGDYDFILVSKDMKEGAKALAAGFANPNKPVVLIDEEKIEKMATDEKFRSQYEGIIAGAKSQLAAMKTKLESSGADVRGFGIQVNDGGTASLFAVLKKSSADQKARIERKREEARAEKKAEAKEAEEERQKERIEERNEDEEKAFDPEDLRQLAVISADDLDLLMSKIDAFVQNDRINSIVTPEEASLGQSIDFRG
ncbi:MAG: DUF6033 family protein [Lachnospiraceae bacterium]|nr:DUF6033 family protein [Lachnospiraceae bacterium]